MRSASDRPLTHRNPIARVCESRFIVDPIQGAHCHIRGCEAAFSEATLCSVPQARRPKRSEAPGPASRFGLPPLRATRSFHFNCHTHPAAQWNNPARSERSGTCTHPSAKREMTWATVACCGTYCLKSRYMDVGLKIRNASPAHQLIPLRDRFMANSCSATPGFREGIYGWMPQPMLEALDGKAECDAAPAALRRRPLAELNGTAAVASGDRPTYG
jgi:hypothetical protein